MDFQILDCEHGGYDYGPLLADIVACERNGCAALVRVSGTDKVEVQRCLDFGAQGIVFPQLSQPVDFAAAATMMDHAPIGTRGFNPFVRAYHYGKPPPNGRPWFVPIIETLESARQIDDIVRLPRIDMLYIGVYDLSAQIGKPGCMDAPELLALVEQILSACRQAGKPAGMMALSSRAAQELAARGVQAIVHGVDSHRIGEAFANVLQPLVGCSLPAGSRPLRKPSTVAYRS